MSASNEIVKLWGTCLLYRKLSRNLVSFKCKNIMESVFFSTLTENREKKFFMVLFGL